MNARSALQRTRLRLPIRLKLAIVSAGLTFVILLLFALVVGAFTEQKLRASFDDELRATAADLQEQFRLEPQPTGPAALTAPPGLIRAAAAGDAVIRIFNRSKHLIAPRPARPALGPPVEGLRDSGDYRVVARPLFTASLRRPSSGFSPIQPPVTEAVAGWVQYAKPRRAVNATIARVRSFLALGVFGGTALAFLAGFAVARRAMRPIAALTRAAREVARTRDPDITLPKPEAGDEVADLAGTLEDMLHELSAARAETEAALSRQRQFVADASHELRTPLTSILANLELLEAELRGEEAEIAGSALRSSRRMRRLVADLLLLARADAGRRAPRKPIDLAAVAREAAAEAAPLAPGHELSVEAADGTLVEGAPDDLHRLALNLIENGLIHTPPGTSVRVEVGREGDSAALEVADDGPGVPARMRERIFERFSRADGDARAAGAGARSAGSGLGLAIVRAVAEAHEGSVELLQGDRGARFRVTLPALTSEEGATPHDAGRVSPRA